MFMGGESTDGNDAVTSSSFAALLLQLANI